MSTLCIGDSHVKILKLHLSAYRSSSTAYNIVELCLVYYFGISGGLVSCDRHLELLSTSERHHKPHHLIVFFLGGNDLEDNESDWSAECVVYKLISVLTLLRMRYSLKTVTVLSYFPRLRTRSISPEIYKLRVIEVNNFLQDSCKNHQLTFWGLRGFTESKHEVLCDSLGAHLIFRPL